MMIAIELSENEVGNLLVALNGFGVQGEQNMIAVLMLAQKLRKAVEESKRPVEAPKEE
jgi:hypothetical protein